MAKPKAKRSKRKAKPKPRRSAVQKIADSPGRSAWARCEDCPYWDEHLTISATTRRLEARVSQQAYMLESLMREREKLRSAYRQTVKAAAALNEKHQRPGRRRRYLSRLCAWIKQHGRRRDG